LVVEDDEDVCARVREILEGLGYTVLAAASADQALHIADSHEGPIDLLLCDVLLPDVNGPRLARQLAVSRAAMKVVFMSGHTDEVIGPSGLTSEWPFIQKPFTGDALARKIRERLDTAPPEAGVDETDPRAESSKN
jgi:DNA-binding response OmpR family regulator